MCFTGQFEFNYIVSLLLYQIVSNYTLFVDYFYFSIISLLFFYATFI